MGERRQRGGAGRVPGATHLPAAVAIALIVAAGLFAERQLLDLAERDLRLAVHAGTETAAQRIEAGTEARLAALVGLRERLARGEPVDGDASLADALAFTARPVTPTPPREAADPAVTAALDALLDEPGLTPHGVRMLAVVPMTTLAFWVSDATAEVAAAFDVATLAGPLEPPLALSLADTGSAHGDAVLRGLRLAGSPFTLAAVPATGWQARPQAVWGVRLMMLAAAALILGPMLRARTLVSERQRNIRALHEREAELDRLSRRLGLALDASKVGVWDYNIDTDTLVWDDRMDELYALPRDGQARVYGDWKGRLHPDDLARAEREFDEAIQLTGRYNSDYRLRLPDGSVRHIRAIGALYSEADGTSKIVGVNWDVTADVLRGTELEAKRLEAEAASIAKSQFLATMSHEIRTPMNGILGMLDLLLRSELAPEQAQRAAIARDSASHLLAILNDVLDFSKLEAHQVTLNPAPTDVARVARDVITLLSAGVEPQRLVLRLDVDGHLPRWLTCDAARLRQVLINLVGNAIKFTEAGGVDVTLGFEPAARPDAEGRLVVAVRDTGVGIALAAQRKLFQRFVQVDGSDSRRRGGTGLGLAISRQLVELMGGSIDVESVPGRGSTFRFTISATPCAGPDAVAPDRPRRRVAPAVASTPARILLAEDNRTNQQILSAYLALAGHSVHLVENGRRAVEAVASERFDLVLMDIQMPELDGVAAARRIRALAGPESLVPIIALTANAMEGDREEYLAAGMSDYVTKPITPDALFDAIARAIPG